MVGDALAVDEDARLVMRGAGIVRIRVRDIDARRQIDEDALTARRDAGEAGDVASAFLGEIGEVIELRGSQRSVEAVHFDAALECDTEAFGRPRTVRQSSPKSAIAARGIDSATIAGNQKGETGVSSCADNCTRSAISSSSKGVRIQSVPGNVVSIVVQQNLGGRIHE